MDLDSALTDKPAEGASATDILRADHAEVRRLFGEYERVRHDGHARAAVAQSLCMQLELHDALEREIFYPAVRECDPEFIEQAARAHEAIAAAAERVRLHADAGEATHAAIAELKAAVEPHVHDEEQRLFRRVEEKTASTLCDLGLSLIKRKEELTRSTASFEGPAT